MMRTTCAMLLPRTYEPFAFLFCFFTFKSVFIVLTYDPNLRVGMPFENRL